MLTHFKLALRSLAKAPGFTAVAILTLALGIGISTSSFSTTNAFLLRSLPYPQSDELVRIFRTIPLFNTANHAPAVILEMQDTLKSVSDVTPYYYDQTSFSQGNEPPELVPGICAGVGVFNALRLQPAQGRGFLPEDGVEGQGKVVVITDRMWKKRFASDPGVVGKVVRINGEMLTVVGIMPESWHAPLIWNDAEYIRPWIVYPNFRTAHGQAWLDCFARLRPGYSVEQASSEVATLSARLAKEFPKEHGSDGMRAVGFAASNLGGINTVLIWLVTGLAIAVLLVACANLASLQLARSFGRSRELAIRASLGANRLQLMMPQLVESMILALAGGVLGLIFTAWVNKIMGNSLSISGEQGFDIPLDGRVLVFALSTSLLTGLVFGLVPAWLASRTPAANALKEGARGSTTGPAHNRLRFSLVVAEVALSLILVATASAFAIATKSIMKGDMGWKPEGVFMTGLNRPYNRYADAGRQREHTKALLEKLQAIPGVQHAAICSALPVFSYFNTSPVLSDRQDAGDLPKAPNTDLVSVTSDYFSLLGIRLVEGRLWDAELPEAGPDVVVINETFAKRFWPGESAVGKRFRLGEAKELSEVIGVVADVRMAVSLGQPINTLQCYSPMSRRPHAYVFVALRGSASPESYTSAVRKAVYDLDQDLPLVTPSSITAFVAGALSNLELIVYNLGVYALMALLISGIGIYGVISHLTMQRTRDIGVRMALGAQQSQIMHMVLGQGMKLLLIGLTLGVTGSLVLMRVLNSAMAGFGFPGPWLQGVTVMVLFAVTLLACYLPARRAAHLDPVEALRAD